MRQWWPSASSSRSPIRAASASSSSLRPQALVEVVDVQQRGVAALERDQQRARVAEPLGHLQRLGAERQRALARRRRSAGGRRAAARSWTASEWSSSPNALRAPPRAARCSRGRPRRPRRGGRRSRARPRRAPARSPCARASRAAAANVSRAAGSPARSSAAPSASTHVEPRLAARQRAPVVLGRLLVGQRRGRLLAGGERVADGLVGPALEEVVGELGRVRAAARLQRLADAPVQAHAPARALALVERLAHERVREDEAVDFVRLAHQAGRGRLLEHADDAVAGLVDQRLEQREVELATDHRGHAQHLVGGRR